MPKSPPQTKPPAPGAGAQSPPFARRTGGILLVGVLLVVVGWLAAGGTRLRPGDGWQELSGGQGRIRWVATVTSGDIAPPSIPPWLAPSEGEAVPEPVSAQFGSLPPDTAAAWYVVENRQSVNEMWLPDKREVRLVGGDRGARPWPTGSGGVLLSAARNLQLFYVVVPLELVGKGHRIEFPLMRFGGSRTDPVSLPF